MKTTTTTTKNAIPQDLDKQKSYAKAILQESYYFEWKMKQNASKVKELEQEIERMETAFQSIATNVLHYEEAGGNLDKNLGKEDFSFQQFISCHSYYDSWIEIKKQELNCLKKLADFL